MNETRRKKFEIGLDVAISALNEAIQRKGGREPRRAAALREVLSHRERPAPVSGSDPVKKAITNLAASVHARLLNPAKAEGRPFNELLQYYATERFLYRLSRSKHAEQFVLKGALMLQFWGGPFTRATKDVDPLGRTTAAVNELVEVIRGCVTVRVDDDGLLFDATSISGEEIRQRAHYHGVRIRCRARLGAARIPIRIDVGFGDILTPGARKIVYPTLLDFDAPRLLGDTPETTIAEKFRAMVVLEMANTRLKDLFDIWVLAHGKEFKGEIVAKAIEATFLRRHTPLPKFTSLALTAAFHSTSAKQTQ